MKNKLKENYHRKSIRQYYHDNVNSLQTKTEEPLLTEKTSSGGFKQSETMDNHKARGAVDNTRDETSLSAQLSERYVKHPEVNSLQEQKEGRTLSIPPSGVTKHYGIRVQLERSPSNDADNHPVDTHTIQDNFISPQVEYGDTRGFSNNKPVAFPESHYQHWLKTALGRAYLEMRI